MTGLDDALLNACLAGLRRVGAGKPEAACFVPGRVELIGKHTDYAGGRSATLASACGFRMAGAPRADGTVRMIPCGPPGRAGSAADTAPREFVLGQNADAPSGHWAHYPATTARRIVENFADVLPLKGADIAFASDLPPAAGMSSSSAFMVAAFLTLSRLNGLEQAGPYRQNVRSTEDLAMYLACVENGQSFRSLPGKAGVGTFGGSEDHTGILCGRAGHVCLFSYDPTVFERAIPLGAGLAFVVASCGVQAEKTGARLGDFNRVSARARLAVEAYNEKMGTRYRHLRELALAVGDEGLAEALAAIRAAEAGEPKLAGMNLASRFEQFYREDRQLVPRGLDALARGDFSEWGRVCDESEALGAWGLENSVPQTQALQRLARGLGAAAASSFGAGFGGSVWAMVSLAEAAEFADGWLAAYRGEFPAEGAAATAIITRPGPPARVLPLP